METSTIVMLTPETEDRFTPTAPKTRRHPWYMVVRKQAWLAFLKPGEKLPSVPVGAKKRGLAFEIVRGIDNVTGRDCARIIRVK